MAYTDITTRAGKGSRLEHNVSTKQYREGWDRIFGKTFSRLCPQCGDEVLHKSERHRDRAVMFNNLCKACADSKFKTTHGLSSPRHPLYACWTSMLQRCTNPKAENFKNYGGRGIHVCNEWVENSGRFILWSLENGWRPGLLLDRKDNDGNYEPSNCRFVSSSESNKNKRRTVGCDWCDGYGEVPMGSTKVVCKVCSGSGKLLLPPKDLCE